jgi:hypothetical protein
VACALRFIEISFPHPCAGAALASASLIPF